MALGLLGAPAVARATVELRLVVWDGDESLRVLSEVIKEFESENPGIKVRLENVDYRFFFQRLLAQIAGNAGPDVTMLDPQNMQMFAKRGALLPLDDLIAKTPGFKLEDYYEPIVNVHRWNGQLYVLPRDIAPIGLIYYNKRLFKEAGLPMPDGTWTWDFEPRPELGAKCFTNVMRLLTKKDEAGKVSQWGFAPSWTGAFTDTVVFSQGARYVNNPESFSDLNFTDPRVVRAFDFVANLALEKKWMPSQSELSSVVQSTAVDLFISQRVAMYQCGIWDVPKIRKALVPGKPGFFDWDITLAPGYRDPQTGKTTFAAPTGGSGYGLLASSRHPQEAWKLIQWMAGEPGMRAMARAGIAQPAIRRIAQSEDWIPGPKTPLEQQYPASRIVTDEAAKYVVFPPTADYWMEVSGIVFSRTEPIYLGTSTAAASLKEGQAMAMRRLSTILKEEALPKFDWRLGGLLTLALFAVIVWWIYGPERKRKLSAAQRMENRWSLVFLSPWILGAVIFTIGPMLFSLMMSFSKWDIIQPAQYRGMGNYVEAIFQDPRFWKTVQVTGIYTLVSVPLGILFALVLALLLNAKVRGMPVYRTFFYLPALASTVASALIWRKIFQPEGGLLNYVLFGADGKSDPFGLSRWLAPDGQLPNWLGSESLALPSLIIMSLWGVGGGMVILLAGLQAIPEYYYEAATLDGAGGWKKFLAVTMPLITPSLFFSLITGMIGSFQVFTQAFVMTQGGPNDATRFYMLHLYEQSFGSLRMGYASALAWLLFLVIFVVTRLQWKLNKYVYYEGGNA